LLTVLHRRTQLLREHLRPVRGRLVLLTLLLVANIGLQLLAPQIVRVFLDGALSGTSSRQLVVYALMFLGIASLQQLVSVGFIYMGEDMGWRTTNLLRSRLIGHTLGFDLSFYQNHSPGEMIQRIDDDTTLLATFFSQLILRLIGSVLLVIGILILLFLVSWYIGVALTALAIVSGTVLIRLRSISTPRFIESQQARADLFGFWEEFLNAREDLRSCGADRFVRRRHQAFLRKQLVAVRGAMLRGNIVRQATFACFTTATVVSLAISTYLFLHHAVTLGTVYLVFSYMQLLTIPLDELTTQMRDFQSAGAAMARIEDLLSVEPKIRDGRTDWLGGGPAAVEFDSVSFAYDDAVVLRNISFRVAPGKLLGIVGRTGSGKSTIARLLTRLYDPVAGVVRVDGLDLRLAGVSAVRQRVGVVTQEVQLFTGTLRQNITLFDSQVSDERLLCALDGLGLRAWYTALPGGLDAPISPDSLSAGEAQLVAFARLFLTDPGVMILDEASSRLDPATERFVRTAVGRLLAHRTGIVIAHRLETLDDVDDILVLSEGRIVEYGQRRDLEGKANGHFARLLAQARE